MALSKEEIKSAYPLPVYNYKVEIGPDSVAFSEVSGLAVAYDTFTFKESPVESGAPGPRVMTMPAQAQAVTLTLKKGVVRGASVAALYDWIGSKQLNLIEKKDIFIRLCDENGEPVITWKVTNAFPTKLEAPGFDATSNDAAVESMELTADGLSVEES
jgi:phage tail-like protein